jgi:cystathionine gamma-synthase
MSAHNKGLSGALRPETLAAHGGAEPDTLLGAVVPPLQPSTTYTRRAQDYQIRGKASYTRDHNPTAEPVEGLLARLEGGSEALVFASGLAAAMAVVQAMRPGERVVAQRSMYWGLRAGLEEFCPRWGLGLELVDMTDLDQLDRALKSDRKTLVWMETPSNPLWEVGDIEAVSALCKAAGALLAVDNTVPTPVLTRPLDLGADLVMHSATKYLNGHSDVCAGAVVTAKADEFWARIAYNRSKIGGVLGPFEMWLLLRGLRTLYLRVERASRTAMAVAAHFETHPAVAQVLYPGLASHAGHEIAARQMKGGFGGMLSLRMAAGGEAALRVAKRTRVFLPATSLGGVESLIEHRATIEGDNGAVPADLLRLSIGIEAEADLIADLEQAMDGL